MPLKYSKEFLKDFNNFMDDCYTSEANSFYNPTKSKKDHDNLRSNIAVVFHDYMSDDFELKPVNKSKNGQKLEYNFQSLSRIDYAHLSARKTDSEKELDKVFEDRKKNMDKALSSITDDYVSIFTNESDYGIYLAGEACNNFSATFSDLNAYERQELANKYMEALVYDMCSPGEKVENVKNEASKISSFKSNMDIAMVKTEDRNKAVKNMEYKF